MFSKTIFFAITTALLVGCASPKVVSTKQAGDETMNCGDLKKAYDEALDFENKARKEREVTGTNVAAAIIFWPALLGTYSNSKDAIEAAKDRAAYLTKLAESKNCKLL
jgi:hypothetical protein